jgi:hypothetical protein
MGSPSYILVSRGFPLILCVHFSTSDFYQAAPVWTGTSLMFLITLHPSLAPGTQ